MVSGGQLHRLEREAGLPLDVLERVDGEPLELAADRRARLAPSSPRSRPPRATWPWATRSSPLNTSPSTMRSGSPSRMRVSACDPTWSINGIPARTIRIGPPFGYRPEIEASALTTAAAPAAIRPSAATRSMSRWSMTAMSPGSSRFTRSLVRRSTRAGPVIPAGAALAGRAARELSPHRSTSRRCARSSSSAAWLRACCDSPTPASMRDSSSTRSSPLAVFAVATVRPASSRFATTTWASAIGRHLCQVRHAQHLVARRKIGHQSADCRARLAADPRVDLVEDEGGRRFRQHHAGGQHRTRRARRRTRPSPADERVPPGWRRGERSPGRRRRRPRSPGSTTTSNLAAGIASSRRCGRDLLGQRSRRRAASPRQRRRRSGRGLGRGPTRRRPASRARSS